MRLEMAEIGRRRSVVIPAGLRRKYGSKKGALVIAEACEEGIILRRAVTLPLERYSPERKAEFLLNNAVISKDYAWALKEVKKLGVDPKVSPMRNQGADDH